MIYSIIYGESGLWSSARHQATAIPNLHHVDTDANGLFRKLLIIGQIWNRNRLFFDAGQFQIAIFGIADQAK
jgi:hypothetical protein